ncbi:MAG: hypothetical protein H6627_10940 [Calditrichae bacterium]|nr:hypothetical protein [Calditrichia bacterium]
MSVREIILEKEKQLFEEEFIQFSDQEIAKMQLSESNNIVEHFHGHALMKLPPAEIRFFDWLKKNDNAVWQDIWGDDENLYRVSIDLLPQFLKENNGFPICDLQETPNYYFTQKHIKPEGMAQMESIILKTQNNTKLDIDELVLFELHIAPFDIWHFAYRYDLPLADCKELISEMVYKGWIVHLPDSEDLLRYIDI